MEIKSIGFKETVKKFKEYLLELGYSIKTTEWYHGHLSRLGKFMTALGETAYSAETCASFINKESKAGRPSRHLKAVRLAIRRLDDFIHGKYTWMASKSDAVPECFSKDFNAYLENLKLAGMRESTIRRHYYSCLQILHMFYAERIRLFSEIDPQAIYQVLSKSVNKINDSSTLRSLMQYLFKSGILAVDLSAVVPSVRVRKPIPSVYKKDEIDQLLSSMDTAQNQGKRNYAIILLALRLGIRSGDIVNLQIADFDIKSDVIAFDQGKTGVPQRLALLPELKDAIQSYLTHSRPDTNYPNLFLTCRAPFRPLSVAAVTALITRQIEKSGIVPGGRKRGGHALRMTLASELVSEKVPYEVVRKILGHEDTKSMKHYVKFDLEMLRSCAIEVPPLSGLISKYFRNQEGGKE